MIGEPLCGGTNVNVLFSHIAEVLFAKTSFCFCIRCHRLWQGDRDAIFVARKDLVAAEVTAVCNNVELRCLKRHLSLLGHAGKLRPIAANVGHFMHDDQVMCGIDGDLHVIAYDA